MLSAPLKRSRSQQLQPSLLTYSNSPDEAYVLATDASSDDDRYRYDDDDGEYGEEDELYNRVSGFDAPPSHKQYAQQHKEGIYSPSAYPSQHARKSWTNGSSSRFSFSSKLQGAKDAFASTRKSFHLSDSMAALLQHLRNSASRGHARATEASREYSRPLHNPEQHVDEQKRQQQRRRRAVSYPSQLTQLLPSMASLKQKMSAAAATRDATGKRPPGWARYVGNHSNQTEHESFYAYAQAVDASNQYESPWER